MERLRAMSIENRMMLLESMSSAAIEGNRLAEVCAGTLDRIISGKPVGDRYVCGLGVLLMSMDGGKNIFE